MAQAALAQDVELVQPQVLGLQHAELRGGEAFRRHVQRGVVGQRFLGDQHPAHVDAQVVRVLVQVLPVAQDGARHLVQVAVALGRVRVGERIDLVRGQAEDLAQLADHRAVLVGAVGGQQRHPPAVAVLVEKVARHVVAVLPTEVDVEIGRTAAAGVDEALEVEVQLDGVHVGDAQAVGHQAVGTAAATHVEEAVVLREAHQVPVDQEVAHEVLLRDHAQLALQAFLHGVRRPVVAAQQPVTRLAAQQLQVRTGVMAPGAAVLTAPEVEVHVAAVHQSAGVPHQFGHGGVGAAHLLLGQEAVLRRRHVLRRGGAQQRVGVHRPQQPMHVVVALVAEGGGDQRQHPFLGPALPREAEAVHVGRAHAQVFVGRGPFGQASAEGMDDEGLGQLLHRGAPHLREGRIGQGLTVVQVAGQQLVQLTQALVAARQSDEQRARPTPELDARHGTDLVLVGQPEQVAEPRRAVDVGERHRLQPQVVRMPQHLLGREDAVVEAEPAVDVEQHVAFRIDDHIVDRLTII